MIDADSLLRGKVSAALPLNVEIGLVRAPEEPIWHQYLAGFTAFRRSEASVCFVTDFSTFIVKNLITRRGRMYLDQIGLYASVRQHEGLRHHITELPVQTFCNTLCQPDALVWSVTQRKDNPLYMEYKRMLLARYGYDA
jgi:hypothetical protein